jgi:hypothetical protein
MPGESISSLVDRQAQLWGITRGDLVYQVANLHGTLANRDLDVCKFDTFLDVYTEKVGIGREVMEAHRAQRSEVLLRPTGRLAYCPICFEEDFSAGHTPYFRLDWARIFLTHCRKHRCPLFDWPRVASDGTRLLPSAWFLYPWLTKRKPRGTRYQQYWRDLTLAKHYACGPTLSCQQSTHKWSGLISFEELMYQESIGSPVYSRNSNGKLSEDDLMKRSVLLKRAAVSDGKLPIVDKAPFKDPRVMHFVFRRETLHHVSPSWRDIRSGMQSIACRRAVIYCLADPSIV